MTDGGSGPFLSYGEHAGSAIELAQAELRALETGMQANRALRRRFRGTQKGIEDFG